MSLYGQHPADEAAAVETPPGVGAVGELEKCGPVAADKDIRIAALRVESRPEDRTRRQIDRDDLAVVLTTHHRSDRLHEVEPRGAHRRRRGPGRFAGGEFIAHHPRGPLGQQRGAVGVDPEAGLRHLTRTLDAPDLGACAGVEETDRAGLRPDDEQAVGPEQHFCSVPAKLGVVGPWEGWQVVHHRTRGGVIDLDPTLLATTDGDQRPVGIHRCRPSLKRHRDHRKALPARLQIPHQQPVVRVVVDALRCERQIAPVRGGAMATAATAFGSPSNTTSTVPVATSRRRTPAWSSAIMTKLPSSLRYELELTWFAIPCVVGPIPGAAVNNPSKADSVAALGAIRWASMASKAASWRSEPRNAMDELTSA